MVFTLCICLFKLVLFLYSNAFIHIHLCRSTKLYIFAFFLSMNFNISNIRSVLFLLLKSTPRLRLLQNNTVLKFLLTIAYVIPDNPNTGQTRPLEDKIIYLYHFVIYYYTTKEEFSGVVVPCEFNIQLNSTFFRPPGVMKFAGQRIILDAKKLSFCYIKHI